MAVLQGISTGLMSYSLKKEFLGESLFYREVETYGFEIYSVDLLAMSPTTIQNNIYQQFNTSYSGNVFAKTFQIPGSFSFPEDGRRCSKFEVQVEVIKTPATVGSSQPELSTSYYKGLDSTFFNNYGTALVDFKENFEFEQPENGNRVFNHNLSFSLITGTRQMATQIAAYIFSGASTTTFGISVLSGQSYVFNTGNYQTYFTESYDTIKNNYSFNKRRELLPESGSSSSYDMIHTMEMKENGIFDIEEKYNSRGNLTFVQAQNNLIVQLGGAYTRCNQFFINYKNMQGDINVTMPLVTVPSKTITFYNKKEITANYDVTFTNNPYFNATGETIEQTITLDADEKNFVSIKDNYNIAYNNRQIPASGFLGILVGITGSSPIKSNTYYTSSNFYNSAWPLNEIKCSFGYPFKSNKTTASFEYSNDPKYFKTINNTLFRFLSWTVNDTQPTNIINEYKVINRPTQMSVISYAYQTKEGTLNVNMEAGIGRIANEFTNGFRTNLQPYLQTMYLFGGQIFLSQFNGVFPINFTYFLQNVKYTLNEEGIVQLALTFNYTIKKYVI